MLPTKLPDYIQFLLLPESYPHPVSEVEILQTHVSYILLAGDYVYKWKKSVDFGFLDFSSLEKRRHYCHEEVRLNRRLCPEMYRGVVQLSTEGAAYRLEGPGQPVEYGVKMARLPADRMMERVIERGELEVAHLSAIIDILIPFYQEPSGKAVLPQAGSIEAISKTIDDNLTQIQRFAGGESLGKEQFTLLKKSLSNFLMHHEIFAGRQRQGRIRDCHGDLHSANICLAERLEIFDCIEFNASLRNTDIAADVAFLAMDLDYHGLQDLSDYFIDGFICRSGDLELVSVLDFYKCYRACVRGKIGLLTGNDPALDQADADAALQAARRYFSLAGYYASRL